MSTNFSKPFNQSMATKYWKLPTTINLWGPVKYPQNLVSQINYQANLFEKCVAITLAAVFLIILGMLMFLFCQMRRRLYQAGRKEPNIHFCSSNRGKSHTEIVSDGTRSPTTPGNLKDKQVNMRQICDATANFQPESLILSEENDKKEIKISKHQLKSNSTVTTKEPKICLEETKDANM